MLFTTLLVIVGFVAFYIETTKLHKDIDALEDQIGELENEIVNEKNLIR